MPLSLLFRALVALRRIAYARGLLRVTRPARPLIVVGNLAVGGSGKTPVVLWLVESLRRAGHRPGVVSRGYGGRVEGVAEVTVGADPAVFGDEPLLIASDARCPVFVGRNRPAAVDALIATHPDCSVVISDDGLQHYAMGRSVEIVVVDEKVLGNRMLLPAGPLREPLARLRSADIVIVHGDTPESLGPVLRTTPAYRMRLVPGDVLRLDGGAAEPLMSWQGRRVHAVAGIGRPERFFEMLRSFGLEVDAHPFGDHHRFQPDDLEFSIAAPILMTCKDAVKCRSFAPEDCWEVPVAAQIDADAFSTLLEKLAHGQSPA